MHIPDGDSVGLRWVITADYTCCLRPTKTSLSCIHHSGSSSSVFKVSSHVSLTIQVACLVHLIWVAMILSSIRHLLMDQRHFALISFCEYSLSWITLSQRRTHIRCAASNMRICKRCSPDAVVLLVSYLVWGSVVSEHFNAAYSQDCSHADYGPWHVMVWPEVSC